MNIKQLKCKVILAVKILDLVGMNAKRLSQMLSFIADKMISKEKN